jgi:hypothetical protein
MPENPKPIKLPDSLIAQLAVSAKQMEGLANTGGLLKRLAEQSSVRGLGPGTFDRLARDARALTSPNVGLRDEISGRLAVRKFEESQRERNRQLAQRRAAIEQATIDTPAAIRALIDLEVAGRQEARSQTRIIIALSALALVASIIGLLH